MSASSTIMEDLSPNVDDDGERHEAELKWQDRIHNPIAYLAEMMGEIMYFYQAHKQSDARSFLLAVVNKVNGHVDIKH